MEKNTGNLYPEHKSQDALYMKEWQNLAMAVVINAAKEYKFLYRNSKKSPSPQFLKTLKNRRDWFSTPWCEALLYFGTDGEAVSGSFIVQEIERVVDDNLKKAKQNKKAKEEAV